MNAYDGSQSLIRSFPSKVGASAASASNPRMRPCAHASTPTHTHTRRVEAKQQDFPGHQPRPAMNTYYSDQGLSPSCSPSLKRSFSEMQGARKVVVVNNITVRHTVFGIFQTCARTWPHTM